MKVGIFAGKVTKKGCERTKFGKYDGIRFCIAVRSKKKDEDGKPITDLVLVSGIGNRWLGMADYLEPGGYVTLSGELSIYDGKFQVTLNDISLGPKPQSQGGTSAMPTATPAAVAQEQEEDDDVPF